MSGLLLAALATPALIALAWPWPSLRPIGLKLAPWAALPAAALTLAHFMVTAAAPTLEIPTLFVGIRLGLDETGSAFLLLTSLLWVIAGGFAAAYHREDPSRDSFFGFFVLTMTGSLGLVLAQDLVSFYLFFALMTFAAYGLVIHRRDQEAIRAGRVYLVLAIPGELALMAGVLAFGTAAGWEVAFGVETEAFWAGALSGELTSTFPGPFASPEFLAGLLVAGFAVKAGLAPLHVWLPLAHPVAPTAASALLSGALIKAGLLGWIRVLPTEVAIPSVGAGLVALGALTAIYAVVVGLAQDEAKTILAYSSVSQMGYMAVGTGVLVLEPSLAPLALPAVTIYALHHGLAKGALFLTVGVADRFLTSGPTATLGRWLILICALLPALALGGAPLTSGLFAKTVLVDAATRLDAAWMSSAGSLFFVAATGTVLLMVRFLERLARRMHDAPAPVHPGDRSLGVTVPWALLLIAVAAAPFWVVRAVRIPVEVSTPAFHYAPSSALLPLLLGVGIGAWIHFRPAVLGRAKGIRVPAGDVLVPVERAVVRRLESLRDLTGSTSDR